MSTPHVLQYLYSLDTSSPNLSRYLYCLIQHDEKDQYLSSLQGPELDRLVDFLDGALSAIPTTDHVYRQCLHKLQAICDHHMTLPSSHNISGDLARVGDYPISVDGGTADVWEGTHGGRKVCIKCPRVSEMDLQAVTQSFLKEAVIWKRLRHPNVVPFIGVTTKPLQFVSEYMPNGTLTKYVKKNPSADRIGLLLDVAEGLNYLHANYTIHGDLKGPNILVDHNGNARLTDFGLTSVVRGLNSILVTPVKGYTEAWAAPEVLEKGDKATPEADVFALGMVVIEVFTGRYPFSGFTTPVIASMIMDGKRPAHPQVAQELGLTDSVWDMTLRCWRQDPAHRPTATEVVGLLHECYRLRSVNLPLSSLAPYPPTEHVGVATNHVPVSRVPTNGESTPTEPLGTSHNSSQTIFQARETSADLNPVLNSPHEPLPLALHTLSDSGNSNNNHLSTVHGMRTAHANSHPMTLTLDAEPEESGPEAAERRINEIAKELAHGNPRPGGEGIIELRRLCGYYCTVPTSYRLEGVMKEGDYPQSTSKAAEIWKGMYNGEVVALKVLRVPQGDPQAQTIQSRFCKEAVLMKQLEHINIIPFYGVSMTVGELCLVFPCYENGSIMEYLKRKPHISRFTLLSGATSGLCFLHEKSLVHGALRPIHVLIDDNGVARLTTRGDVNNDRYSAPELHRPYGHDLDELTVTKESDAYGMAMVVFEVLTGDRPYSGHDDIVALSKVLAGEFPQRPSDGITDPVWELLEECWRMDPSKRPTTVQIRDALSQFQPFPPSVEEPPHSDDYRTVQTPGVHSLGSIFGVAREPIDEIAQRLVHKKSRQAVNDTVELANLCHQHRALPTLYKLDGVMNDQDRPQRISTETEIRRGRYKKEVVALKVLRVPRKDPDIREFTSYFCEGVVFMMQVKHPNILPFYGVSTTIADFCLVFPWYENGNIMEYLERNPAANRFDLLSHVANGLLFLHITGVKHGALIPSHVLIDNSGVARLSIYVAGTESCRYSAPEIPPPEDRYMRFDPATPMGDVYGMAMIAYEVLTGNIPFYGCDNTAALSRIRAGKRPQRPSDGIADPVWQFLEKCWRKDPQKRPSAAQVYDVFSKLRSTPQKTPPQKLKLYVQSIGILLNEPKQQRVYVKFKHESEEHTTSLTTEVAAGGKYIWNAPETWLITTKYSGETISLEVHSRASRFKPAKVCATGSFSLRNNINKQTHVKLEALGSTGEGVLDIFLAAI